MIPTNDTIDITINNLGKVKVNYPPLSNDSKTIRISFHFITSLFNTILFIKVNCPIVE